jgi:hypothetical protein
MLLLSLFSPGLIKFELLGLSATSWDVAILLSLGPAYYVWRSTGSRTDYFSRPLVIAMAGLLVWYLVAGLRNANDVQAWTIVAMFVRGQLVMTLVVLAGSFVGARGVTRTIFWTGVAISIPTLVLYLLNAGDFPWGERRPYGDLILMFDEYQVTRIIGFAQDPNFLAIPTVFAIGAGLFFPQGSRQRFVQGLALGLLGLVLLLTVSRSGIAGGLLAAGVTLVAVYIRGTSQIRRTAVMSAILGAIILVVVTVMGIALTTELSGRSVVVQLLDRYGRTADSPRLVIWENILTFRFSEEAAPTATTAAPTATATTAAPTATATTAAPTATTTLPTVTPIETAVPLATTVPTVRPEPTQKPSPRRVVQTILGDGNSSNLRVQGVHSHSSYLDIWIELGLIGALLWLVVGYLSIDQLRRVLPVKNFNDTSLFGAAAVAAVMIAVMMSSATMMSLPYVWFALGLIWLVRLQNTNPGNEPDRD